MLTTKQVDILIKSRRPVLFREVYFGEAFGPAFERVLIARDRRNVTTDKGEIIARDNLTIVR